MGTVQGCQPCHSVSSNSGLVVRLPRQLSSLYDGPAGSRGVYHAVAVRFFYRDREHEGASRRVASARRRHEMNAEEGEAVGRH